MTADLERIYSYVDVIHEKREANYPEFRGVIKEYDIYNKELKDPFLQCLVKASHYKYWEGYIILGATFSVVSAFAGAAAALLLVPLDIKDKKVVLSSAFATSCVLNRFVNSSYMNLENSKFEYEVGKCIENYEDFIYG